MRKPGPTPADCLEGARVGLANARRLYVASAYLRRSGFAREAVLLLATALEEAVKAGVLHRAWMFRDRPALFETALDGWKQMTKGPGAHERKHAAAPYLGSTSLTVNLIVGILVDVLAKDRSGSTTSKILDALLGSALQPLPGWYARLWGERQAIYVDWQDGRWSHPGGDAAAFYDEGRIYFLKLAHILRSDVGRPN